MSSDDTFAAAAAVLRKHRIFSVIVKGDAGPAGIITERDFVNLVADGHDRGRSGSEIA